MKIGNVILAIFLWLCIPASFFLGGIFGFFGGGVGGGVLCAVISPLVLFILGLIALITGMESKSQVVKQDITIKDVRSDFDDRNGKTKDILETDDEALKVLKLRYAKGEITKEEYEQMKKDLEV